MSNQNLFNALRDVCNGYIATADDMAFIIDAVRRDDIAHAAANYTPPKHTPGPWVCINEGNEYSVEAPDEYPGITYICQSICQGLDNGEADARLISQAPDMLSLLEEVNEHLKDVLIGKWPMPGKCTDLVGMITSVTQKAKGGKQ